MREANGGLERPPPGPTPSLAGEHGSRRGGPSLTATQRFFAVLVLVYLAKQVLFVVAFAPFSGHDEVAHYSYLRTLATEARLPVLPELDAWRAAAGSGQIPPFDRIPDALYPYCRYVLYWHCEPRNWDWARTPPRMVTFQGELYPTGYQYTANHPPLYYALMTPVYWLTAGASPVVQHYWLRLAAIPFGLLTVWLSYRLVRTLFPGDAFLSVTVPAFIAFQPQLSYEAAMLNNDIVAIALFTLLLVLIVTGCRDRFPPRLCVGLGVVLGLALLTKSTTLLAAPVIALAIIGASGWRDVRAWVAKGALVVLPAALFAAPWYLFLYRTYGNLDALDQIARLQQYWNYYGREAPSFTAMLFNRDFAVMRFRETWGEFGWRLLPLSTELLWAIALPLVAGVVGLLVYIWRVARQRPAPRDAVMQPQPWQVLALIALGATCLIAYLAVIQFGLRFELTQARYFFPALPAAAVLLLLGLRTVVPARLRPYAPGLIFAGLVVLNVLIFTQYVFPVFLQAGA